MPSQERAERVAEREWWKGVPATGQSVAHEVPTWHPRERTYRKRGSSNTETEDGRIAPMTLASWAVFTSTYGYVRRCAAAADPKTPWIVLEYLCRTSAYQLRKTSETMAKHPGQESCDAYKDIEYKNSDHIDALYVFECLSANPILEAKQVEFIIGMMNSLQSDRWNKYRDWTDISWNLSRHPHLSASRKERLVREGTCEAGLGDPSGTLDLAMKEYGRRTRDATGIRLAADHLKLNEEDLAILTDRWKHCMSDSIEESQRGMPSNWHVEDGLEEVLGTGAALLVTHPNIREIDQIAVLTELKRDGVFSSIWEAALRAAMNSRHGAAEIVSEIFQARTESVKKNGGRPIHRSEIETWEKLLTEMAHHDPVMSDSSTIMSAFERSSETAALALGNKKLVRRLAWSPELVRRGLLCNKKEVRLLALKAASGLHAKTQSERMLHSQSLPDMASQEETFQQKRNSPDLCQGTEEVVIRRG